MQDLIPFYPYLISCAFYNNKDRKSVIYLASESFVDVSERENLEFRLKELLKIYNRCKRNRIEFDVDKIVGEITWNNWNERPYIELANRVKLYGKKASIDGIHLKMHEQYRQELVNEMVKNGLNPCRYGDYERFVSKERAYEDSKK